MQRFCIEIRVLTIDEEGDQVGDPYYQTTSNYASTDLDLVMAIAGAHQMEVGADMLRYQNQGNTTISHTDPRDKDNEE